MIWRILHVLKNGCPCCKNAVALGTSFSSSNSPSIDRIDPLFSYANRQANQNWSIECFRCNVRKNNASINQRAILIGSLSRILSTIEQQDPSQLELKPNPPSHVRHHRASCESCSNNSMRWCGDCKSHVPFAQFGKAYCLIHSKLRIKETNSRRKTPGPRRKQKIAAHICSQECTPDDKFPFCNFYLHNSHVSDSSHMTMSKTYCNSCLRIIATFNAARTRSRKLVKPFDEGSEFKHSLLTKLFETTNCAYCELPLRKELGHAGVQTSSSASIDCIIPENGYTSTNVVICCYQCNAHKNDMTLKELEHLQKYCTWRLANPSILDPPTELFE